jgi:hypothetical protein
MLFKSYGNFAPDSELYAADLYFGGSEPDTIRDWRYSVAMYNGEDGKIMRYANIIKDVNGDGYDDIAVAIQDLDYLTEYGNSIYIFYGGENISAEPDVILNGVGTFPIVRSAGDVNNDGFNDIIVGYFNNSTSVKIFYGGNEIQPLGTVISYAPGYSIYGNVGSAGDFDGNGIDDFMYFTGGTSLPGQGRICSRGYIFHQCELSK